MVDVHYVSYSTLHPCLYHCSASPRVHFKRSVVPNSQFNPSTKSIYPPPHHSAQHSAHNLIPSPQHRSLHTLPLLCSGHSKWASIKHSKGRADTQKSIQRTALTAQIEQASKTGSRAALEAAVTAAKKASVPKAVIDAAIARGAGSPGAPVGEPVTLECFLVHDEDRLAFIIEGNGGARLLKDLRKVLKIHKAVEGRTKYLFEERWLVNVTCDDLNPDLQHRFQGIDVTLTDLGESKYGFKIPKDQASLLMFKQVADSINLTIDSIRSAWVGGEESEVNAWTRRAKEVEDFVHDLRRVSGIGEVHYNSFLRNLYTDLPYL
ncbi:MAG: hypothetical protein M1814_003550 [Vezdaea aestivalis]|nr:MAG: hypothetical protein M1814_003550 [Vezdaea aestivalis]